MTEERVPAAYTEMDILEVREVINKAGISKSNFRVSYDRGGLWAEIKK